MENGLWSTLLWFVILSAIISTPLATRIAGETGTPIIVPLENYDNENYYGLVTLGSSSQEQELKIAFDTRTSDFIVISDKVQCSEPGQCGFIKSSDSNTLEENAEFDVTLIDGAKYKGKLAAVSVQVGQSDSRVVANIQLGLATEASSTDVGAAGRFGLGFDGSANTNIAAAFKSFITQTDVAQQFSVYLRRETNPGHSYNSGELYIGGHNTNHMASPKFLTSVNVVKRNDVLTSWFFPIDRIIVNGQTIELNDNDFYGDGVQGTLAVPDPSVGSISLPTKLFEKLTGMVLKVDTAKMVSLSGWFTCDKLPESLPSIEFVVNDVNLKVGPENYISLQKIVKCNIRIKRNDWKFIVLGAPFLHRYYTKFDYENQKIEFAEAKQPDVLPQDRQPGKSTREYMELLKLLQPS